MIYLPWIKSCSSLIVEIQWSRLHGTISFLADLNLYENMNIMINTTTKEILWPRYVHLLVSPMLISMAKPLMAGIVVLSKPCENLELPDFSSELLSEFKNINGDKLDLLLM